MSLLIQNHSNAVNSLTPADADALTMHRGLRARDVSDESGFTLIELLIVIIILGILLAIAVPAYLSIQDKASEVAARAQIRTILPDINQYEVENGSYAGIDVATLKADYDPSLNDTKVYVVSQNDTGTDDSFYVCANIGGWFAEQIGPASPISPGTNDPAQLVGGTSGANCDPLITLT